MATYHVTKDQVSVSAYLGYDDAMYVYSGGIANKTEVGGGDLFVYSGGTANDVSNVLTGAVYISKGGVANNVYDDNYVAVYNGGEVNNIEITSWGDLDVSGGTVDNVYHNLGGISISDGGTVNSVVNYGGVSVNSGGTVNSAMIYSGGGVTVSSGGIANAVTITSAGDLDVYSGGVAENVSINSGGYFVVHSGGSASNINAENGGRLHLEVCEDTYWEGKHGGDSFEMKDAAVSGVAVNSNFQLIVREKGVASDISVNTGGYYHVNGIHRGELTIMEDCWDVVISEWGTLDFTVSDRTVNDNYLVNNMALISVRGTLAVTVAPDQEAGVYKLAQGAANYSNAKFAIGTDSTDFGTLTVNGDSLTYDDKIYTLSESNGNLTLTVDGTTPDLPDDGGHAVKVYSDGVLTRQANVITNAVIRENSEDRMEVLSGGLASNTIVRNDGTVVVVGDGTVRDIVVSNGGWLYVQGEEILPEDRDFYYYTLRAYASNVIIHDGGYGSFMGADVTDLVVSAGGEARVLGYTDVVTETIVGHLYDCEIKSGGLLTIGTSQELYGNIIFGGTIAVESYVDVYGDITFDLQERTGADGYIVDDISNLDCMEYTITVTADQANGVYKLAQGASGFDYNVSLWDGSDDYGTLTVNGDSLSYDDKTYTLSESNGNLTLTIANSVTPGPDPDPDPEPDVEGGAVTIYVGNVIVEQADTITGAEITGDDQNLMTVHSGGVANETTVAGFGQIEVYAGGAVNDTTVDADGIMDVYAGTINDTVINDGDVILSGGVANRTQINEGGWLDVSSGSIANSNTIHEGGELFVYEGGTANNNVVQSGGVIRNIGGNISHNTVSGGEIWLDCGVASDTIIRDGGWFEVNEDGFAYDTEIDAGGSMYIQAAGYAQDITVEAGGELRVFEDGTAIAVKENGGGVFVDPGADVTFTANTFRNVTLSEGDWATLHSGTIGIDTVVGLNCNMEVFSGGIASNTFVNGNLWIYDGGTHRGTLQIGEDAYVEAEEGAVIDFTVSEQSPDDDYLINDLSLIYGSPDYTITVSGSQSAGTYKLAAGVDADDFDTVLTIYNENGSFGDLTVNGDDLLYNDVLYSLDLENGDLTLTIGGEIDVTPPDAPYAILSPDTPTNKTVLVTVSYSNDSVVKQYKIGNNAWTNYTGAFSVFNNNTIYFRAEDAAGNESTSQIVVSNIDKIAPDAPIAVVNPDTPTNKYVTVTVTYSNDSVVKQYKKGNNGLWHDYTGSFTVSANNTIYFRAEDAAGNESTSQIVVSNIDKTAPEKPVVVLSPSTPTNQDVTVTVTYSDDSVVRQYKIGSGSWQDYNTAFTITANTTLYFRAEDAVGNECTSQVVVSNIDKIAPDAPIARADITNITNRNVTVTAIFSDDSVVREYSLDHKKWQAYTTGIVFETNGLVYFRGEDAAGNQSKVTSYVVSNIDKVAPDAPVVRADVTTLTNQDVTLTATYSPDSLVKEYSFDKKTWMAYTAGVVLSTNGMAFFRGTDAAGNHSAITSYAVTNIDKVAPDAPVAKANITTETRDDVIVTATFSTDSVIREYSLDGKKWFAYTKGITFDSNGTVYFRGTDAAGNVSAVTRYDVTNIVDIVYPPSDLKVTVNKYKLTMSWSKLEVEKGQKAAYVVSVNGNTDDSKSNKYTLSNLMPGYYECMVKGIITEKGKKNITTEWSGSVTATVADVTPPKMGKVKGEQNEYDPDSVTVTWTPATDNNNDEIYEYVVTCNGQSKTVNGNTLFCTFDNVTGDKAVITVTAYDTGFGGTPLASKPGKATVKMKDLIDPDKVCDVSLDVLTAKYQATFSWSVAADNSGKNVKYQIRLDGNDSKYINASKNTVKISNLSIGWHTVEVRAVDSNKNEGEWSEAYTFEVKDMTAPKSVSVKAKVAGNDVTLTWKKPSDNVGVTGYVLKYGLADEDVDDWTVIDDLSGDTLSFGIEDLEKGKYGFQMVAYDGEKNYSSSKSGKFVIKTDLVSASDSACLDLMAWQNDTLTDVYSAAIDSMPGEQEKKNPIFLQLA